MIVKTTREVSTGRRYVQHNPSPKCFTAPKKIRPHLSLGNRQKTLFSNKYAAFLCCKRRAEQTCARGGGGGDFSHEL